MSHLDEGLIHAALDGEIDAPERARVEAHLASCPACRARYDEAIGYRDLARGLVLALDPVAAPATASLARPAPAAASLSRPAPAPVRARPRQGWPLIVAWAATLVAAVGLGYRLGDRPATAASELAFDSRSLAAGNSSPVADEPSRAASADPATAGPPAEARSAPSSTPARRDQEAKAVASETDPAPSREEVAAPPPRAEPAPFARVAAGKDESTAVAARVVAENAVADRQEDSMGTPAAAQKADARLGSAAGRRNRVAATAPAPMADERGGESTRGLTRDLLKLDGPAAFNPADQRRREISAVAAIAALGGSIRLIDGLVPARFESQGEIVRVVYRTGFGPLVLEQWRAGDLLAHELVAPTGAPADSIQAWGKRVR